MGGFKSIVSSLNILCELQIFCCKITTMHTNEMHIVVDGGCLKQINIAYCFNVNYLLHI